MVNIDKLTTSEDVKDYREFTKKSKIRLIIFMILWLISYLTCTISLFFWKWFIVPIISFIFLFLLIYFIALDCYKINFGYVLLVLFWIFLFETISFIILLWFSWYLVIELVLFNVAIWTLLFLLDWQLENRTWFSPFSYFTEWWFLIVSLLTVFFCVLMVWKYTKIPFTCDDIESFPEKVVETTVNPLKNTRNKVVSWFKCEDILSRPELRITWNPLSKSADLASADKVENLFMNIRGFLESGTSTIDIKNQVSKTTCEYYINVLQNTQKNWKIQFAWIIIWYLLLVILRIFGVYKYWKRTVEKEVIV